MFPAQFALSRPRVLNSLKKLQDELNRCLTGDGLLTSSAIAEALRLTIRGNLNRAGMKDEAEAVQVMYSAACAAENSFLAAIDSDLADDPLQMEFHRENRQAELTALSAWIANMLADFGSADIELDPHANRVLVNGQSFDIDNPAAYAMLTAIIKAKGELVTGKAIRKLPGCNVKLSRLVSSWPPEVQAVVSSKPGPGGGYWFCPEK
jgi:hypothetical protein